jgi:hypothetical protein
MTARLRQQAKQQRRRVRNAPDDGSALVMVLVLLTILALALGAMFADAGANLTASTVFAGQNNKVYAADGGVEIAIQQLRAKVSLCSSPTPMPLNPETKIDGLTVSITCRLTTAGDVIDSTAPASDSGQSAITSTAVVSISADQSRTVNIVSWVTPVH